MPRLAPKPVKLDERERKELEKILARHSTPQQVVKRGKIVLLASEGNNHRTIARELGISREMARLWRERWTTVETKRCSSKRETIRCRTTRFTNKIQYRTSIKIVGHSL